MHGWTENESHAHNIDSCFYVHAFFVIYFFANLHAYVTMVIDIRKDTIFAGRPIYNLIFDRPSPTLPTYTEAHSARLAMG